MTKHLLRRMVELGLLIALIFALVSLFNSSPPDEVVSEELAAPAIVPTASLPAYPPPQPTQPSYPPPNNPTAIPPTQIPTSPPEICKFDKQEPVTKSERSLDAYDFSEPKIVLDSKGSIEIADWSPSGEQLLITHDIYEANQQLIEGVHMSTGERQLYAKRQSSGTKPVWLSTPGGVAYTTMVDGQAELWFSKGNPETGEKLVKGLSSEFVAVQPNGKQFLYLADKQLNQVDKLSEVKSIDIDMSEWEYPVAGQQSVSVPYKIVWRPESSQVLFYNKNYLFLLDLDREQVCEIDLNQERNSEVERKWAVVARWSPNGRYLAMLTTRGEAPVSFIDLSILDTATGKVQSIPAQAISPGQFYITEVSWSPNSQILAVSASVEEKEGRAATGLYLVDVVTSFSRRVLPQTVFGQGNAGQNMAWSPTGQQLALVCATPEKSALCSIEVNVKD